MAVGRHVLKTYFVTVVNAIGKDNIALQSRTPAEAFPHRYFFAGLELILRHSPLCLQYELRRVTLDEIQCTFRL
jgi:hypothetical protein